MGDNNSAWGRVLDDGTVEVRISESWVAVGAYPDGAAEEALALFTRKFDDLEAQVVLIEQRLKARASGTDLRKSLQKLRVEIDTPQAVGDFVQLRERIDGLVAQIDSLVEQQSAERAEALGRALSEREGLVAEIERLAATPPASIRWKETQTRVDELFASWKAQQQQGPRIPKAQADELWKRFRNARHTLDRARRAHFQARDKAAKEAKSVKRELIERAEALSSKGAAGIADYRKLLDEWKRAPRAHRSLDDQLWAQFKAAGDVLYQDKASQEKAEDEANRENGELKSKLIEEFRTLLELSDHREALERLRLFHERFRQIGPAPKSVAQELDRVIKKFDQHVKKLEAEHWEKTDPEKQARSSSFLEQLDAQVAELEKQRDEAERRGDTAAIAELQAQIDQKSAWRGVLTQS